MIIVEIFSGHGCHLCERAKEVLVHIQRRHPFELRETVVREGDALFDQMKDRIPVIHINGRYAFHYRVREEELIRRLDEAAEDRP
jgi:glutaredoxin